MEIKTAEFVKSSAVFKELPPPNYPEYGFVGRSNVGKSSLINRLCNRKSLAKTSSTPGKTQLINHFVIDESWYMADLPGYGYARVSKKKREGFSGMILDYVTKRENLLTVFVLVDSRIKPQKIDLEFIEFLGVQGVPFTIVFTKIDKPTQKEYSQNQRAFKQALRAQWEELPPMMHTSSITGKGVPALLDYIEATNPLFTR
ncbi:MAG: ribosome biogenesis GTP-binding protein YihA/YsxC [Bacteroidota bacterium]